MEIIVGNDFDRYNPGDFFRSLEGHLFFGKSGGQRGKEFSGNISVNEECFHGVAGSRVLCLCVDNNGNGFFLVTCFVGVDMADAFRMAHDGDFCVVHDVAHKFVGAPGNEQIDESVALE